MDCRKIFKGLHESQNMTKFTNLKQPGLLEVQSRIPGNPGIAFRFNGYCQIEKL